MFVYHGDRARSTANNGQRPSAVGTTGLVALVAFRTMAVGVAFGTSLARSLVLIAVS